jgi:hypothetical protein
MKFTNFEDCKSDFDYKACIKIRRIAAYNKSEESFRNALAKYLNVNIKTVKAYLRGEFTNPQETTAEITDEQGYARSDFLLAVEEGREFKNEPLKNAFIFLLERRYELFEKQWLKHSESTLDAIREIDAQFNELIELSHRMKAYSNNRGQSYILPEYPECFTGERFKIITDKLDQEVTVKRLDIDSYE